MSTLDTAGQTKQLTGTPGADLGCDTFLSPNEVHISSKKCRCVEINVEDLTYLLCIFITILDRSQQNFLDY